MSKVSVAFALALLLANFARSQVAENLLYSFTGFRQGSDGISPYAGLILDSAGNLYGTTSTGGASGYGSVFELTPSNGGWTETILHSFSGSDGSVPYAGLILDSVGNLYGTTTGVLAGEEGTVFELTPSNGGWTEAVLHSFTGSDGRNPTAGLIFDSAGNLYGTAFGGANGYGTVFELTPSNGSWTETVLHSFTGSDGSGPYAGLIFDSAGNLYGTTAGGGANGYGTVFELTHSNGSWTETVLHSFAGTDGSSPLAGLIFDSTGNLYGTTNGGGANGYGTVFELTHPNGGWTETILHSFTGGSDGSNPYAGLIFDSAGDLYGTTYMGGANARGTAFKVDTSNNETVLHSFGGTGDGLEPFFGGLVMDSEGNIYGTTEGGGADNYGVVFEITGAVPSSPWQPLKNQPSFNASTALLLTDGTVMVQETCASHWWQLVPSKTGSYVNGVWYSLASSTGYGPLYYGSAVLPDGKVIIEGGEDVNYDDGKGCQSGKETAQGAIYDPTTDAWSTISPPAGWTHIGDAASVVLPTGLFMIGNCGNDALLSICNASWNKAQAITRTGGGWIMTGTGKADTNNEEGWTLLPSGEVLTVDIWDPPNTELYNPNPVPGSWSTAGSTPVKLVDTVNHEIGPAVLLANGTVLATGATGSNAIYDLVTSTWSDGPPFPLNYAGKHLAIPDGPAALLPNGNVLLDTSPVIETVNGKAMYPSGSDFFEFNGTTLTLTGVPGPPNARNDPAYVGRMLLLPTGQVLFTDGTDQVEIYTPTGANYSGAPTISSYPPNVTPGITYSVTGTQFNGLSQAVAYGDDAQAATNYPLVRITNNHTKHVFYARTHGHSTMGVATGSTVVSTNFDAPSNLETGASTLVVVANGIPSKSVAVTVQ